MQLSPSPLEILSQVFREVQIVASEGENHGPGQIDVERHVEALSDCPRQWRVRLVIRLSGQKETAPPPYTGCIAVEGHYAVHEKYPYDPERLIRVTGASMLYGATREMVSAITSRGPHGMLTLPSVSFLGPDETPEPSQKPAGRKTRRTRGKGKTRA
ncbi:MAG: hypothetical protein D6781_08710 [Verrucomicrobia bacterium]|nr:MAG: hypothetical protein D6781_08710 [Verrucomicrobiota bacterium]